MKGISQRAGLKLEFNLLFYFLKTTLEPSGSYIAAIALGRTVGLNDDWHVQPCNDLQSLSVKLLCFNTMRLHFKIFLGHEDFSAVPYTGIFCYSKSH